MRSELTASESPARMTFVARYITVLVFFLMATVLCLRFPVQAFQHPEIRLPQDFSVYFRAVERMERSEQPYRVEEYSAFKYSPGVLALLMLLPSDPRTAWVGFSSLSILFFFLLPLVLVWREKWSWRLSLVLILGLALAWKGVLETLDYGQFELLIYGLLLAAAGLAERRPEASGFLVALVALVKPPWALVVFPFLVYLSSSRRKREGLGDIIWFCVGGGLAGVLIAVLLPWVSFGWDRSLFLYGHWWSLLQNQPTDLYLSPINQSLWIAWVRWLGVPGGFGMMLALLLGMLLGWRLIRVQRRPGSSANSLAWISPWLILVQVLNPLSWRWGSVFLFGLPLAIWYRHLHQSTPSLVRWRWFCLLVFLSLFLLQMNPVVSLLGLEHWTELHDSSSITLFWLVGILLALS